MTEDDFWRICADEDIEVCWSRRKYAFYFTVPDDDLRIIVLPERFTGVRLLFAMFHELAHHLLHGGDQPSMALMGRSDPKWEFEADAVALIALMPDIEVRDPPPFEESRYTQKLWRDRHRLKFLYLV